MASQHARKDYQKYLKTKEWLDFAKQERRRVGYRCQRCKVTGKRLNVHHKMYRRNRAGGWKLPKRGEAEVLCDICHASEHGKGVMVRI